MSAAAGQPDREEVAAKAVALGIDALGVCSWQALEAEAPEFDKPSSLSSYLTTLLVLVRRYPTGVACSPDEALRQYATGRTSRHLEEAAAALAYWLEEHDVMASLLSSSIPDLRRQPVSYACPAGQGSLLLRQAAVAAGLGSLGLNEMLLTPRFGPRVFVTGVLTDLDLEPDEPFAGELCPGLEGCGRCAAVCPQGAIPTEAPPGAPLAEVRGLDAAACARSSQPYGPDRMVEHLGDLFRAAAEGEASRVANSVTTQRLWFGLTVLRQGAYTGCQSCELVCPVGEDYGQIEASPARRSDLPQPVVPLLRDGLVRIESSARREGRHP